MNANHLQLLINEVIILGGAPMNVGNSPNRVNVNVRLGSKVNCKLCSLSLCSQMNVINIYIE